MKKKPIIALAMAVVLAFATLSSMQAVDADDVQEDIGYPIEESYEREDEQAAEYEQTDEQESAQEDEQSEEIAEEVATSLASPIVALTEDGILQWEAVEGAVFYDLYVDEVLRTGFQAYITYFDLNLLDLLPGEYQIQIRAISGVEDFADSPLSEAVTFEVAFLDITTLPAPIAVPPVPQPNVTNPWSNSDFIPRGGFRGGGFCRCFMMASFFNLGEDTP
ncbi:MAG: hypothetical protein FWG65_05050 [Turicibacter sp.]|nr:hypothetical protein [Turicibacter sp.]